MKSNLKKNNFSDVENRKDDQEIKIDNLKTKNDLQKLKILQNSI